MSPIEPRTTRNTRTIPKRNLSFACLAYFAVEIDSRLSSVFHLWLNIIMPASLIHRLGITAPVETIDRAIARLQ